MSRKLTPEERAEAGKEFTRLIRLRSDPDAKWSEELSVQLSVAYYRSHYGQEPPADYAKPKKDKPRRKSGRVPRATNHVSGVLRSRLKMTFFKSALAEAGAVFLFVMTHERLGNDQNRHRTRPP